MEKMLNKCLLIYLFVIVCLFSSKQLDSALRLEIKHHGKAFELQEMCVASSVLSHEIWFVSN